MAVVSTPEEARLLCYMYMGQACTSLLYDSEMFEEINGPLSNGTGGPSPYLCNGHINTRPGLGRPFGIARSVLSHRARQKGHLDRLCI